jgi:uncharacterized protein
MFWTKMAVVWIGLVLLGWLGLSATEMARADSAKLEVPRLTVMGEGKFDVPPDKAVVSFAVESAGERLSEVQQDNQIRMNKVFDEFRKLEISPHLIQTTSFQVIPEYPPPPRRVSADSLEEHTPRIIGYRVIHRVNVEVRDLERVGTVVDRTMKAGANQFSGIAWGLQEEEPIKLKALQQAARQARAKAEALSQALEVKLVRILNVTEGGVSILVPQVRQRAMVSAMAMESGGESSISAGEISVRGSVTLEYEISH